MTVTGFIGVVHLKAMPGDPACIEDTFHTVRDAALADAEALAEGGADAVIIENFGSAPFGKGDASSRLPPHQVAFMATVADAIKRRFELTVGVNCLRNDVISALGIAAAVDLAFVRVNVHTGAYVTDQGIIEGEAATSLRYRKALGARGVAILADVLVKHAAPLVPIDVEGAVKDTLLRGHADAIVVTGAATGAPISAALLEQVRAATGGEGKVILGSGVNRGNVATLAPYAHGAIVGTLLKVDGVLSAPIDPERVQAIAELLGEHLAR